VSGERKKLVVKQRKSILINSLSFIKILSLILIFYFINLSLNTEHNG
jgi:hypothetical protein